MQRDNLLRILVIDDDSLARSTMEKQLGDHRLSFATDFSGGKRELEKANIDLCFIDLQLGKEDLSYSGLDLVKIAVAKGIYAAVVSGHDSKTEVSKALSLGAKDFYGKGTGVAGMRQIVDRYLQRQQQPKRLDIFKDRFVTEDPETQESILAMLKYAASGVPVLILGPSGTGKTSLARLVHELSGRPGQFIPINCSAFNEELLEVELFGSKIGAFTGAVESRKGKLAMADEGTLFLDEVGSMSLQMQSKLLKAIEEKEFYPVGSDVPEKADFRVVAATWANPKQLVKDGSMRPDFLARIRGKIVELKPLAQRRCDVFPLIWHFTRNSARLAFAPDAEQELMNYSWPDNVRELENVVKLLVDGSDSFVTIEKLKELLVVRAGKSSESLLTDEQYDHMIRHGVPETVQRLVDEAVGRTMQESGGVRTHVLSNLRISRRRLYSSINRSQPSQSAH